MTTPRSILIILMGSIGDVVRGLAIVAPLKAAYPDAKLTWLVEPRCISLVQQHSNIDEVLLFDRKKPLRGVFGLARELRLRRFDLCLDLQRHLKSGFFSMLSRAPRRIGFHRSNAKEFNWLFQTEYIEPASDELPKIRHYLLFLRRLGVSFQEPLQFGLDERAIPTATKALLSGIPKSYVVLILGSSWPSKDWLLEGYQKLMGSIVENTEQTVVLCGDRSQTQRSLDLSSKGQNSRLVNLVGKTSLVDLVYLLKYARACVGPDSGPAHIAAAVKTPHVTLFGATSPQRVAPYNSESLSLQSSIGCSPCYRRHCPGLDRLCQRLISADAVWERLRSAIELKPNGGGHF